MAICIVSPFSWAKVRRYWSGEIPMRRTKLRRMVSALPNPQRAAMTLTVSADSSS
jgi:hypothetical protein